MAESQGAQHVTGGTILPRCHTLLFAPQEQRRRVLLRAQSDVTDTAEDVPRVFIRRPQGRPFLLQQRELLDFGDV